MTREEAHHFEALKERIAEKQAADAPVRPPGEWSGQEIEAFREDLQEAVQGTVSERWFYTHMKSGEQKKLPRIDTLDLLSRYVGYRNWEAFKAAHPYEPAPGEEGGKKRSGKRKRLVRAFSLLLLLMVFGALPFLEREEEAYRLCFVDGDTGGKVRGGGIEVRLLEEGESPIVRSPDSNGCLELSMRKGKLRFIVEAPYYRSDTILRDAEGRKERRERVPLEPDDYAMLIGAWSDQDPEDRVKRRQRLEGMIADDARIFQVHGEEERGVAMYNKEEFIEKLTMPLRSLKRIEVIATRYNEEGRIRSIRFRQVSEKTDKP